MAKHCCPDNSFAIKCQLIDEVQQWPIIINKGHTRHAILSDRAEEFEHIGIAIWKTGE